MATSYKTPGVYIEEISTLPPSIAEVSTAIPAFIGCTANGPKPDSKSGVVVPIVARINTLLEFETMFGQANPLGFTVNAQASAIDKNVMEISSISPVAPTYDFLLYYSLSMFYKNGGGSCYIISIGNFDTVPTLAQFEDGLAALEKEDEPTLIVLTEAVGLVAADYLALCLAALAQCEKLGDRFAILDVSAVAKGSDVGNFRDNIGTNNLMYGAAYYPYLQTVLNPLYDEDKVTITFSGLPVAWEKTLGATGIIVRYSGAPTDLPKVNISAGTNGSALTFSVSAQALSISNTTGKTGADIVTAWKTWAADKNNQAMGFDIVPAGDGSGAVPVSGDPVALDVVNITLTSIKSNNTALYNQIKTSLATQRVVLPPSPAITGVYASVDRDRGVWKAPANVSLSSVIGPVLKITHDDQENLNVDPTGGKSINAIRAFAGKGTLVWGARTLAGNDNEWRYISVRRLFIMIEESTMKSTAFAVFEPNDATTWLKVKAMIEAYLYGLWQQGALAGPTADAAYFVNVGLGKTMTTQDVLEGRLIIEIGIAAVRPAEFIILRFTHKLQQA